MAGKADTMDRIPGDIMITRRVIDDFLREQGLRRVLNAKDLWAISVGTVIAGTFFGWNYGLGVAGPIGFFLSTLAVSLFYLFFVLTLLELGTAIPLAGGPYAYARRAMGPFWGYLTGLVTVLEFLFAATAVVISIGAYVNAVVPDLPPTPVSLAVFALFLLWSILGVKEVAIVELLVTVSALSGIILFLMGSAPAFAWSNVVTTPMLPFGWKGILAAVPFAMWFYISIEGISVSAEETKNPARDMPLGVVTGLLTVVAASVAVWFFSTAAVPWQELAKTSNPLSWVLSKVQSHDRNLLVLFTGLGLCGLLASLQGMINGFSRQAYALARAGYLPRILGGVHPRFRTPHTAILLPGAAGLVMVSTGWDSIYITISGFASLIMYILVLVSFLILRHREPRLERPYSVPFYPLVPVAGLVMATVFLVAFSLYKLSAIRYVLAALALGLIYYFSWARYHISFDAPEEAESAGAQIRRQIQTPEVFGHSRKQEKESTRPP